MKIVLVTLIVLSSSITVAYAMNPSLATLLQDIITLLTTHDSDVQTAVSTLPRTEHVQGYQDYILAVGETPMIHSSPTYPGGAHVSLTILDPSLSPGDSILISGSISMMMGTVLRLHLSSIVSLGISFFSGMKDQYLIFITQLPSHTIL
jgi:hypothetical protein